MKLIIALAMIASLTACDLTSNLLQMNKSGSAFAWNAFAPGKQSVKNINVKGATPNAVLFDQKEPSNLWDKIQTELHLPIPKNQPRLDDQKTWYLRHPAYMHRVAKRARPFLYYITQELEKEGLPMEIALLPIVESGYDAFAYSHGSASGMWQFISSSGERFGMKQTWWYDGRRDVIASTQGAIKYLRYLNKLFDGNWLHALAAYNSGEGRVRRAIKKNKLAGKPTDFWSLDLPRETRAYVPKLLALADILKNQDEYKFRWPDIPNEPAIEVVDTGVQIDLAIAAQMANLTITELQSLNPGYNRWATDPEGPHRLVVPIENASILGDALAQTSKKDRINWVRHKVKSGETLGLIARNYETSLKVIKQVNNLNHDTIFVNDDLVVPVSLKELTAYTLSEEQRLFRTQSLKRAKHKLEHKVKRGDTLSVIAHTHKVGIQELAKWNKMAPGDPLQIDANIVIWTNQAPVSNNQAIVSTVMRNVFYTVKSGDSLARIARRFKVRVGDLTQWNNLGSGKYIQPGQKLKIIVDVKET